MEYRKYENVIAVRLDKGEEITEQIKKIAEAEKIKFASVSGIGATDDFTVGIFDLDKGEYNQKKFITNHEITNITGNISTFNGEEYVHLHINCANSEGKIIGGHLLRGIISITAEIVITTADGTAERIRDDDLKINKLIF